MHMRLSEIRQHPSFVLTNEVSDIDTRCENIDHTLGYIYQLGISDTDSFLGASYSCLCG